jgi:hypothetical protein
MKRQGKITEAMGGEGSGRRPWRRAHARDRGREMAEQLGAGVDLEGLMSKARAAADTQDDKED